MARKRPSVFISYAHGDQQHMDAVRSLADQLRKHGLDATIDRYVVRPPRGWDNWMRVQIEESDFVVMICDQTYKQRFEGRTPRGSGKGVKWEGAIISYTLYEEEQNSRFIPILLELEGRPGDVDHFPKILRTHTKYQLQPPPYELSTNAGYQALYRELTKQPESPKPDLGPIQSLAPGSMQRPPGDASLEASEDPPSPTAHWISVVLRPVELPIDDEEPQYAYQITHWPEEQEHPHPQTMTGGLRDIQNALKARLVWWDETKDEPYRGKSAALMIEFALPEDHFDLDVSLWEGLTGNPLGEEFPTVVRWLETPDSAGPRRSSKFWNDRWNVLLGHDGTTSWKAAHLVSCPSAKYPAGRAARGKRQAFCVSFHEPPPAAQLLETLRDGMPVALWPRVRHEQFEARIEALAARPVQQLPENVRSDRCNCECHHPLLTLFWDDPTRPIAQPPLLPLSS